MVSVQSPAQAPPGGRELPYFRVLLPPAILMAAVTGAAVALVERSARIAVVTCGAVATLLVVLTAAEVVRRGRRIRELGAEHERRTALLERRLTGYAEQNLHLARHILPEALYIMHAGNSTREVLLRLGEREPTFHDLDEAQRELLRMTLDIIDKEELLRESAHRTYTTVARRIQAIVHQQNDELMEMEYDHGNNPEVFDDLLRIDHGTALIGRLADSIGVIAGGRPSRQWPKPVPLYSVLRGGMSRILEYPRIKLESIAKINIRGISVEPVIHACAELMDNATRFSPPATKVHVNAMEVQSGIAIEIEDAGISLSEEGRARVEQILEAASRGEQILDGGGTPILGLAVVGRLCKEFKMQCSLRVSAYGGVRAVLVVPSEMITDGPADIYAHGIGATATSTLDLGDIKGPERPPKRRRPTNPRIPAGVSLDDDVPVITEWTAEGLPQRRSKGNPAADRAAAYVAQAAEERAAKEAAERGEEDIWASYTPPARPAGPEPGVGFEAFWSALKENAPEGVHPTDFTRNPTAYLHLVDGERNHPNESSARAGAGDDEGDLK